MWDFDVTGRFSGAEAGEVGREIAGGGVDEFL